MVKIILALLVILIIVLVANGLGVINEGFIQCSEKSSYSFTGTPAPDYNMKIKECGEMKGCTWKKIPGFNNSGNCSDECITRTSEETCGAVSGCNWTDTCKRTADKPDEQDKLNKFFKDKENQLAKEAREKKAKIESEKAATAAKAKRDVDAAKRILDTKRNAAATATKRKADAARKVEADRKALILRKQREKAAEKAAKCNFVPWGDTIRSCIDRCASIEDRDSWGGKACTDNKCYKICKKCTNNHCKWNDPVKIASVSGGIVPLKQVIKAIPSENKTGIKVMWRSNENDIKSFLIYFYKTYDSNNSIFTQKIEKKNNNNYIEEIVENIEENQYYTIGICAVNNDNKVGPISNLERVKTDGLTSYF
jgi:hypothetical protein